MLKIKNTLAIKMLEACGLKTPNTWTLGRLRGKLLSMDNFLQRDKWKEIENVKLQKLFKRCWKASIRKEKDLMVYDNKQAYTNDGIVNLDGTKKEELMSTKKTKKKVSKKKIKKVVKKTLMDHKAKEPQENPKKKSKKKAVKKVSKKVTKKTETKKKDGRNIGISDSILQCIKRRPASPDQILEKLISKFPDRDSKKMMRTIKTQLGGALKAKGHNIKKLPARYVIEE